MEELDLNELYETRRRLENKIENYFGDEQKYTGDQGYQDLLSDLGEVEEQIEEVEQSEARDKARALLFASLVANSGKYWMTPEDLGIGDVEKKEILDRLMDQEKSRATERCHDCNVKPGEKHMDGCDVARCTRCKGQAISCDCEGATTDEVDVWTGMWPGTQECYDLKLIAYSDPAKLGGTGWTFDYNELARRRAHE